MPQPTSTSDSVGRARFSQWSGSADQSHIAPGKESGSAEIAVTFRKISQPTKFRFAMGVLAVGTLDGRVVLHDAETFAELWGKETPPINSNGTMGVVVSPGGSTLASVSADLTCKLLDSSSGDLRRTLAGHDSHGYCSCKLVRPPRGGGVECDEISADCSVSGHADALWAAAFSPAGRRLATCSRDGTSRIWATNKQNPPSGMGSAVRSRRRESGFGQECLRVGEVTPAAERFEGWVRAVAFSPDGTCCATGHNDFSVRIWDSHTGEELQRFKNHTGAVWSVAFSPCGEKLASASQDRTVKIWDVVSGFLLRTLGIRMHLPFDICGYVRSVAFSPTGNLLASGGEDKVLRVWCSKTGLLQRSLTGHRNVVSGQHPWRISAASAQRPSSCTRAAPVAALGSRPNIHWRVSRSSVNAPRLVSCRSAP